MRARRAEAAQRVTPRSLFFAGAGAVVLLVQIPIVKMILDDPQVLYLGVWDARTFWLFVALTFLLAPAAAGAVVAFVGRWRPAAGALLLCAGASYLLAKQADFHYLLVQFTLAPWRRPLVVGLWLGLGLLSWRYRRRLVELLGLCAMFSVGVLGWFSLEAGPWSLDARAAAPAPRVTSAAMDVAPVFLLTFEKLVAPYILDEQDHVFAKRLPNLAAFIENADLYPQAYANTGATTYSLKTLYTGRVMTVEKNWANHPNVRDLLGRERAVTMVLDTMEYCRPSRDTCVHSIGVEHTAGQELIAGWYKTYAHTVLPGRVQAAFSLLGWRFDPRSTMWAREEENTEGGAKMMAHRRVGARQFEHLIEAVRAAGPEPRLYLMHNYISDSPGARTSVLTGRTEAQRAQDLEAGRANLAALDEWVGRFVVALEEAGIYDRSLVAITTDTGHDPRLMYVRGEPELPFSEEMARIFLAIKRPGQRRGRVLRGVMQQVDVLPTMLADLGLDPTGYEFEGRPMTDSRQTPSLQERPMEFVIPSIGAGILHYQLDDLNGPLRRLKGRVVRW